MSMLTKSVDLLFKRIMTLEAIKYKRGRLEILDQLLLPAESKFISIENVEDGWKAIKHMQVRGAPAIAIVGCLSLAVELTKTIIESEEKLQHFIVNKLDYLISARPTAVNMKNAADELKKLILDSKDSVDSLKTKVIEEIEQMLMNDIETNKKLGDFGANAVLDGLNGSEKVSVLTHCNTGSLATAGYGTALGIIRSLARMGRLSHVYCTETRPYNQGARLTAYELVFENIPATLICDSMAAWLMKTKKIDAVITGADHVAANGDVANKIGTYSLAVLAKHHDVPFYVAVPSTTFHPDTKSGDDIVIEERPHKEMTHINGVQVAANGIHCWNPAFDVTPAELVTGIVTEFGVFRPETLRNQLK